MHALMSDVPAKQQIAMGVAPWELNRDSLLPRIRDSRAGDIAEGDSRQYVTAVAWAK